MKLAVMQTGRIVGFLESTAERGVIFTYSVEYLADEKATSLSISLPLRKSPYSQASTMPFFSGLLPDGDLRRRIADRLHISESSSLRLLDALGGECAGTVSLVRTEADGTTPAESAYSGYEEIPSGELERLILDAERIPLMFPRGNTRLSLAGAQEKIPLLRRDGRWYKPVGTAPSSHILKPASTTFPGIVHNEFAMLRLASELGLSVPVVELATLGRPTLIIERYDRRILDGGIERLHQEDFCQALGFLPDCKYQADGGPGFSELATLIRRTCRAPVLDIEQLVSIAVFNVLAGNCDAHGKNYSLLYKGTGISLAPFYDLVSTAYWPELDTKLSMRFGSTYKLTEIRNTDMNIFARDVGVNPKLVTMQAELLARKAVLAWDKIIKLPELQGFSVLTESLHLGWNLRAKQLLGY
jgi:serine/threonine-protein kinase HipA